MKHQLRKTFLPLTVSTVFILTLISWFTSQNLVSNTQPSGEEMTRFEEEYGAQPYTGEKVVLSKAEWKERLTPEQFYVMREDGTERAFTGKLYKNEENGIYHCSACDLPLFSSETKYESGTGWPSFWAPINPSNIGYRIDKSLFLSERVEVHCNRCESHLGHVFNDGPPPTGHRYCINSVALKFVPLMVKEN